MTSGFLSAPHNTVPDKASLNNFKETSFITKIPYTRYFNLAAV